VRSRRPLALLDSHSNRKGAPTFVFSSPPRSFPHFEFQENPCPPSPPPPRYTRVAYLPACRPFALHRLSPPEYLSGLAPRNFGTKETSPALATATFVARREPDIKTKSTHQRVARLLAASSARPWTMGPTPHRPHIRRHDNSRTRQDQAVTDAPPSLRVAPEGMRECLMARPVPVRTRMVGHGPMRTADLISGDRGRSRTGHPPILSLASAGEGG
jgi:hypothetical protein